MAHSEQAVAEHAFAETGKGSGGGGGGRGAYTGRNKGVQAVRLGYVAGGGC